jgi:peptide/nickel transport system substrate-binding protein
LVEGADAGCASCSSPLWRWPAVSGVWPLSPCYSNLVLFDPLKPQESAETVIPELAERWSWQDNYRNLVFFLRKNVNYGRMQDVWLDK